MRLFVFNTKTSPLPEYLKTVAVFLGAFFINALFVSFLSGFLGINLKTSSFICLIIVVVLTYLGLKNYAFNAKVDYFFRPSSQSAKPSKYRAPLKSKNKRYSSR